MVAELRRLGVNVLTAEGQRLVDDCLRNFYEPADRKGFWSLAGDTTLEEHLTGRVPASPATIARARREGITVGTAMANEQFASAFTGPVPADQRKGSAAFKEDLCRIFDLGEARPAETGKDAFGDAIRAALAKEGR